MYIKRLFDILSAFIGLLLTLPIGIVVAICIVLDSPGGVFFRQVRVGRHGKHFRIYKFRSMTHATERGREITVGADARITKVGKVIRKYKIDELPQLLNVLLGDMSIVGPRPEVPQYVAHYSTEDMEVLQVRPGITDLASIRFRNENDILANQVAPEAYYLQQILPEKLRLGRVYIEHRSFWLDMKIIFATFYVIVSDNEQQVLQRLFKDIIKTTNTPSSRDLETREK